MPLSFPIHLPRHAFSVRDVARAGDVWRCFQEAAVEGSTRCGWPPTRYREVGSAFVVRAMTVVHHAEPHYGEPLEATTWVANFRRGVLTTREIRLSTPRGLMAAASQEWVHVTAGLRPVRASPDCLKAFSPEDVEATQGLPEWVPCDPSPVFSFAFDLWHSWMDPLGHANHPMYLDWCDESLCRRMVQAGLKPEALQPVAETVSWKLGVEAPERILVNSQFVGLTPTQDAVFQHQILNGAGRVAATATTVRRLNDGTGEALSEMARGQ
jgi:acyl-CoA thioesterase FadM